MNPLPSETHNNEAFQGEVPPGINQRQSSHHSQKNAANSYIGFYSRGPAPSFDAYSVRGLISIQYLPKFKTMSNHSVGNSVKFRYAYKQPCIQTSISNAVALKFLKQK